MGKTVAIIQARQASTRLPNKVLADIAGHPLLWHVVNRVCQAKSLNQVIVATGSLPANDGIVALCNQYRWDYCTGSDDDVLDRYYRAARLASADVVVRITGDCPMIDPAVIDGVVALLHKTSADYASATEMDGCQDGLDAEAFTFDLLRRARDGATESTEREHCTLWMRRNAAKPVVYAGAPKGGIKLSVDTIEDLEQVRRIYAERATHRRYV